MIFSISFLLPFTVKYCVVGSYFANIMQILRKARAISLLNCRVAANIMQIVRKARAISLLNCRVAANIMQI
ncbi:MAG: hypothetical protein ACI31D_05740, partial [Candidatus Limisoma sp.]